MEPPESDTLRRAQEEELALRHQLAELLLEQRRAEEEAARLTERARLEGADPRVAEAAAHERRRAADLAEDVARRRAALRAQEGVVAQLRTAPPPPA